MAFALLDASDQDRGYLNVVSCDISLPNSLELLWQTEKRNIIAPNSLAKSTLLLYEYKSTEGAHWLVCIGIKKELLCYRKQAQPSKSTCSHHAFEFQVLLVEWQCGRTLLLSSQDTMHHFTVMTSTLILS